jgi:hypothetical protein
MNVLSAPAVALNDDDHEEDIHLECSKSPHQD